jgi:hypothetical protein
MIDKINEMIEKYKKYQEPLSQFERDFWTLQFMLLDLEELKKLADKDYLKELCKTIGCSGIDKECPGNVNCEILKKLAEDKDNI